MSSISGAAEKLLIHLKVFEDLKQSDASKGAGIMGKPRYLCLTRKSFMLLIECAKMEPLLTHSVCLHYFLEKRNKCRLYKTKRNQNGSFSIGKSWSLEDIRVAEVIDVSSE